MIYLLLMFSCSYVKHEVGNDYKFTAQHQQYIKEIERTGYVLDKNNFISFSTSEIDFNAGEWYKYLVFFSQRNNLSGKIISKIDLSDGFYEDTLLIYKTDMSDKQVIIWKQEDEYWSYLNIFLFSQDNIVLIGDLSIGLNCKNCDSFNFPISGINVQEIEEVLKVNFKGQVIYRGSISQGTPYNSINVETDKLILLYKETNSKINY